jgi:glc operon protein GlcG
MKSFIITLLSCITTMPVLYAQPVSETYELTLEGAKQIMNTAMSHAKTIEAPGAAIAIVDAAGTLVLFERLNGTFLISSDVSMGKARSAALFRFPTMRLEESINDGRPALISTGEVALKGGVPIIFRGKVIGAIGVSGAASADQDVEIATAALQAQFLRTTLIN